MEHLINPRTPDPFCQPNAGCQYGADVKRLGEPGGKRPSSDKVKVMNALIDPAPRTKQEHYYRSMMDVIHARFKVFFFTDSFSICHLRSYTLAGDV